MMRHDTYYDESRYRFDTIWCPIRMVVIVITTMISMKHLGYLARTYARAHTRTYIHIHTHAQTRIHTHTHALTRINTHTDAHAHTFGSTIFLLFLT